MNAPKNFWPKKRIVQRANRFRPICLYILIFLILIPLDISAQRVIDAPAELKSVDVIEHTGDKIPFDLIFTDDHGQRVNIGGYFNQDKPAILILGYYTCPMLCNLVFNGVRDAINDMPLALGRDYTIITVSIDSSETEVVAAAKKKNYLKSLKKEVSDSAWMFLTGSADQSRSLADAIGFKYYYDEKSEQYAHAALITILTPDGTISRYLYGIQFNTRDLRLALVEASEGRIGNTLDKILLYCYHYDPDRRGYTLFAERLMRLGGLITLAFLAVFIGFLFFREKGKKTREQIGRN